MSSGSVFITKHVTGEQARLAVLVFYMLVLVHVFIMHFQFRSTIAKHLHLSCKQFSLER